MLLAWLYVWLKLHVKAKTKGKGKGGHLIDYVGEREFTFRSRQSIFLPWTKVMPIRAPHTLCFDLIHQCQMVLDSFVVWYCTSTLNQRTKTLAYKSTNSSLIKADRLDDPIFHADTLQCYPFDRQGDTIL